MIRRNLKAGIALLLLATLTIKLVESSVKKTKAEKGQNEGSQLAESEDLSEENVNGNYIGRRMVGRGVNIAVNNKLGKFFIVRVLSSQCLNCDFS